MTDPLDLIGRLRQSRRPDIALGMLLAVEQVHQLDDVPDAVAAAISKLAAEVYDDADDVLVELINNPEGEYVDEDELADDEPEPWT